MGTAFSPLLGEILTFFKFRLMTFPSETAFESLKQNLRYGTCLPYSFITYDYGNF